MSELSLNLENRTAEGKQVIKSRKNDIVPSVVYGGQIEALSTQSPLVETSKAVNTAGRHTPIDIVIDGILKGLDAQVSVMAINVIDCIISIGFIYFFVPLR